MKLSVIVSEVKLWLKNAYSSTLGTEQRAWCMLGITDRNTQAHGSASGPVVDLTPSGIAEHFDREDLNTQFEKQYNGSDIPTKECHSYTQVEINLIAAAHRSFAARHKTRMQLYRDDCEVKRYHTTSAITVAYAKHSVAKERAEEKR